jgi:DNA-binding CsgD family transcriptional regulator/transposase-like protein
MLCAGESPRLEGEVAEHVRMLAELDRRLPPILVRRSTMEVIDGIHRLRAATLRGDQMIEVRYFDGDEAEAFVEAVKANVTHGMPLTLHDRETAAARIVASHPHYSDRSIAAITGLSAKRVAAARRRVTGEVGGVRIGRDGRVRPLNSADGRRLASKIIAGNPGASLQDVAREAGLSPTTVRDVRERMRRGDDPVPPRQRPTEPQAQPPRQLHGRTGPDKVERRPFRDRTALLRNLQTDPALRYSERGRSVLRWLLERVSGPDGWERQIDSIPSHCAYLVAEIARSCADEWSMFARRLEERIQRSA